MLARLQSQVLPDLSFLADGIHLVAIHPETRAVAAKWFGDDRAVGETWCREHNSAGANVYWTVNEVRPGFDGKPTKADITRVRFAHVDVDPPNDGRPWDPATVLESCGPFRPTIVINSGNGIQALWGVSGSPTQAEIEALNRGIAHRLGGDACWNVDRLLRVPGTINYPDAKKRTRGRAETLATLQSASSVTWAMHMLAGSFPAPPSKSPTEEAEVGPFDPVPWQKLRKPPSDLLRARITAEQVVGQRSEQVAAVAKMILHEGYTREEVAGVLFCPDNPISAHVLDQADPERAARRMAARAHGPNREDPFGDAPPRDAVPAEGRAADTHLGMALAYRGARRPHLRHYRDEFYDWTGAGYARVEDAHLRGELWQHLESGGHRPTIGKVTSVLDAVTSPSILSLGLDGPPAWLSGRDDMRALDCVATKSGILHLPTGTLLPPTPDFFSINALAFAYDASAPRPGRWLRFLDDLWTDHEADCIAALQEFMGYLLTPETRLQKALLLIGPKRSGKGTIAHVMRSLVGPENTASPSFANLGEQFGLAPLLGRQLALIADGRLDARQGPQVAENLLRISGEDPVSVNRKFLRTVDVRLRVRFVVMTNEMPRFPDRSGALTNRFIVLPMVRSFFGQEDTGLKDELDAELPGILNWAIEGWRRVRAAGRIAQPAAGAGFVEDMMDLGSPVIAFVE